MKIIVLTIGKTQDSLMAQAIDRYASRITHYAPFQYIQLPDVKTGRGGVGAERQKEMEGQLLLQNIQPGDRVVLLDERGREYTSREFAALIDRSMVTLQRNLVFVIGGPYGFSADVYNRADSQIALSRMTLTHEMARLFFTEQIYRAFTIIRGEPYHHD